MKCANCEQDVESTLYVDGVWSCYPCAEAQQRRRADEPTTKTVLGRVPQPAYEIPIEFMQRGNRIVELEMQLEDAQRALKAAKLEYLRKGVELAKKHANPYVSWCSEVSSEASINWVLLDKELKKLEEELA